MLHTFLFCLALVQDGTVISEAMEVRLQALKIRVVDGTGQPVEGLGQQRFTLLINGKETEIQTFEEVSPPAASNSEDRLSSVPPQEGGFQSLQRQKATGAAPRIMVMVVDSATMTKTTFERAKQQLVQQIGQIVKPGDQVRLAQIETGMRHIQDFSDDPQRLQESIAGLKYQGTFRTQLMFLQNDIHDDLSDFYREVVNMSLENLSEDTSINHNTANRVNRHAAQKQVLKHQHLNTVMINFKLLAEYLSTFDGEKSILYVTGGGYLDEDTDFLFQEMTDRLAEREIEVNALHLVDRNGANPPMVIPFQIRRELEFANSWNPAMLKGKSISRSLSNQSYNSRNSILENGVQFKSGPLNAAHETGGTYLFTNNMSTIKNNLAQIDRISRHFYRVWFRAESGKQKVEVGITGKQDGWELFHAKQFGKKVPYLQMDKDQRRVLFLAALQQEFDLAFVEADWAQYSFFAQDKKGDPLYRFAVCGRAAAEHFPKNGYEIGMVLLDEENKILALKHRLISGGADGHAFGFYDLLESNQEPDRIRVSIRNLDSDQLSIQTLSPAHTVATQPSLSTISMVPTGSQALVPLYQMDGKEAPEASDPFVFHPGSIPPGVSRQFSRGEKLLAFFQLQNRNEAHENFDVFMALLHQGARTPCQFNILLNQPLGDKASRYLVEIATDQLQTGPYQLMIKVQNQNGQGVLASQDFQLL